GAAANPIHILTEALAGLHDQTGRITLENFYEGVEETPENIKSSWDKLGQTSESFLGQVGLSVPSGEKGRSVLELTWARPTAEVNG
ncbi:peptidase dimerization domain-containing protein, partial [Bacillus sp. SIMBA_031]